MDDRTEKIFNIAFDPRGNEQEAISAFLRLRKLGNVSDMKSKVESARPKAPQHKDRRQINQKVVGVLFLNFIIDVARIFCNIFHHQPNTYKI